MNVTKEMINNLRLGAESIRRWMPGALPANEHGQVHFARALAESAAEAIEAALPFLTAALPSQSGRTVTKEMVSAGVLAILYGDFRVFPYGNSLFENCDLNKLAECVLTAALSAQAAPVVPDGWRLVPVEPTREMSNAAYDANLDIYWSYLADGRPGGPEDVYRAMLAAAPAAAQAAVKPLGADFTKAIYDNIEGLYEAAPTPRPTPEPVAKKRHVDCRYPKCMSSAAGVCDGPCVLSALTTPPADLREENERCPVCAETLNDDDICATDIEMGCCHAACLAGSPTVDLETGDPNDGPISTYRYSDLNNFTSATALSAAHEAGKAEERERASFDVKRFVQAPCYICGYNGHSYYQPSVHKCAEVYHTAIRSREVKS